MSPPQSKEIFLMPQHKESLPLWKYRLIFFTLCTQRLFIDFKALSQSRNIHSIQILEKVLYKQLPNLVAAPMEMPPQTQKHD